LGYVLIAHSHAIYMVKMKSKSSRLVFIKKWSVVNHNLYSKKHRQSMKKYISIYFLCGIIAVALFKTSLKSSYIWLILKLPHSKKGFKTASPSPAGAQYFPHIVCCPISFLHLQSETDILLGRMSRWPRNSIYSLPVKDRSTSKPRKYSSSPALTTFY
jgi:hypothetical protein